MRLMLLALLLWPVLAVAGWDFARSSIDTDENHVRGTAEGWHPGAAEAEICNGCRGGLHAQ